MKKKLSVVLVIFLIASCKSNHRIIKDSMRSIGNQSSYINTLPETQSPWPVAVILGIVLLLVIVLAAAYIYYTKQQQAKESKRPPRRVTRMYYPQPTPQPNTPRFDEQLPYSPQQHFPSNPRFSQSSYPHRR